MYARRKTFAVPALAGTYAPEVLYLFVEDSARSVAQRVLELTALIAALPAGAALELDLLKPGGNATKAADWHIATDSWNTQGLQDARQLSGWQGVRLRAKSGGTAGDMPVDVSWF